DDFALPPGQLFAPGGDEGSARVGFHRRLARDTLRGAGHAALAFVALCCARSPRDLAISSMRDLRWLSRSSASSNAPPAMASPIARITWGTASSASRFASARSR